MSKTRFTLRTWTQIGLQILIAIRIKAWDPYVEHFETSHRGREFISRILFPSKMSLIISLWFYDHTNRTDYPKIEAHFLSYDWSNKNSNSTVNIATPEKKPREQREPVFSPILPQIGSTQWAAATSSPSLSIVIGSIQDELAYVAVLSKDHNISVLWFSCRTSCQLREASYQVVNFFQSQAVPVRAPISHKFTWN